MSLQTTPVVGLPADLCTIGNRVLTLSEASRTGRGSSQRCTRAAISKRPLMDVPRAKWSSFAAGTFTVNNYLLIDKGTSRKLTSDAVAGTYSVTQVVDDG